MVRNEYLILTSIYGRIITTYIGSYHEAKEYADYNRWIVMPAVVQYA